jgi:TonB family protein
MKLKSIIAALLLVSTAIGSPVLALGDTSAHYDRWEERLRSRVDALHVYPKGAEKGAKGDVLVRFRIGGDGRPADITVIRSSGHAIFDSAAVRLVARLGRLGAVPSANAVAESITLKLSYGEGSSLAEDKRLARQDSDERMANERRNRLIVSRAERLAESR